MFGGDHSSAHSDTIKFKMSLSFRRGLLFPFFVGHIFSLQILKEYSTSSSRVFFESG